MPGYRKETGYGRCWCERERRGKEMRRWEQVFVLELGLRRHYILSYVDPTVHNSLISSNGGK